MKRKIITIENGVVSVPGDVWMTQHQIADLFGCFVAKVSANIRAILKAGVLDEETVCRIYSYGNGNCVEQYSLEMIITLAFRIRSHNAELFRKWLMRKVIMETMEMQILMCKDFNYTSFN